MDSPKKKRHSHAELIEIFSQKKYRMNFIQDSLMNMTEFSMNYMKMQKIGLMMILTKMNQYRVVH